MRKFLSLIAAAFMTLAVHAQYNIDRIQVAGRIALDYKDYVLAIQHFNICVSYKPYLYEPWYYRGVAKFYLDDFSGAEMDETEAKIGESTVAKVLSARTLNAAIENKNWDGTVSEYEDITHPDPSINYFIVPDEE
jgi:hypothetical protein